MPKAKENDGLRAVRPKLGDRRADSKERPLEGDDDHRERFNALLRVAARKLARED